MSQTVQLSLTRSSDGRGGYTLNILSSAATGDCELVDVDYKNRHPINKLGGNDFHLLPLFDRGGNAFPPCRVCVTASAQYLVPDVQAIGFYQSVTASDWSGTFRLRIGSGGTWTSWYNISESNPATALLELGAVEVFSVSELPSLSSTGQRAAVAVAVMSRSASVDTIEMETSGTPTGHFDAVAHLQTGGGLIKNDIQLVRGNASDIGTELQLTYDGQTTGDILPADSAATADTELESLSNLASGDISIAFKFRNCFPVVFGGSNENTNVPLMTSSVGSVQGVVNGGPVAP